jgi:glutathione reductase (NADPH)
MLWNAAQVAEAQRDAASYGFAEVEPVFDWARFKNSRDVALQRLRSIYDKNLSVDGVTLIRGWAKLLPPRNVQVAETTYSAEHLLLATGGAPRIPNLPGAEWGVTSDGFFEWMSNRAASLS